MVRIIGNPNRGLGLALCNALGIDASDVFGVEIRFFMNEAASIKIFRYITDTDTQHLIKTVSEYELKLKE